MRLQHKAVFLYLPRLEIYTAWTHRSKRQNLEMRSPTGFSADGSFPPLFQQDVPPMLLRTPLARPATQPRMPLSFFLTFFGPEANLSGIGYPWEPPKRKENLRILEEKPRSSSLIPRPQCRRGPRAGRPSPCGRPPPVFSFGHSRSKDLLGWQCERAVHSPANRGE